MNVLIDARTLQLPLTGIGRVVRNLARDLPEVRPKWQTALAMSADAAVPATPAAVRVRGPLSRRWPKPARQVVDVLWWPRHTLIRIARECRADVIVCPAFFSPSA